MNRRGFTIVELLVVFVVLAILASIAVLKYIDLRNHAIVADVQSELNAVRLAAYNYWADKNAFPPDAGLFQRAFPGRAHARFFRATLSTALFASDLISYSTLVVCLCIA